MTDPVNTNRLRHIAPGELILTTEWGAVVVPSTNIRGVHQTSGLGCVLAIDWSRGSDGMFYLPVEEDQATVTRMVRDGRDALDARRTA